MFNLTDNLIDIGTGAGFPGLVLKIYNPDLEVCLLEPNNKKISFLNEVIATLKLKKSLPLIRELRILLKKILKI